MESPLLTPFAPHWPPPSLSTDPEAARLYQDGIAELVGGGAHARSLLNDALARDPRFTLACVALAVIDALEGSPYTLRALNTDVSRGERQHLEVVRALLGEDPRHARDLRREHLAEFPGDLLVVWLDIANDEAVRHPASRRRRV